MEKYGWKRRVGIKGFLNHVLKFLLNPEVNEEALKGFH